LHSERLEFIEQNIFTTESGSSGRPDITILKLFCPGIVDLAAFGVGEDFIRVLDLAKECRVATLVWVMLPSQASVGRFNVLTLGV
jgi:hypothetical protein